MVSQDLLLRALIGAALLTLGLVGGMITHPVRQGDMPRGHRPVRALLIVLSMLPAGAGAWLLGPQLLALDRVLVETPGTYIPDGYPQPRPKTVEANGYADAAASEPAVDPAAGRAWTILLLGGDAGPGRWGLRTDSMNLVRIDPQANDIAILGLPRNLYGAPLPPGPLGEMFPKGFDGLLNAVHGWGDANRDLVADALGAGEEPGATLLSAVVAELTGQPVDAFVLVDMQGFADIIDMLGGIDLQVGHRIALAGPVGDGEPTHLDPGRHRVEGSVALAYARSRSGDSDYGRMSRQRCLLSTLLVQTSPLDILRRWPDVSRTLGENVRTNLEPRELRALLTAFSGGIGDARTLGLTPPIVMPSRWDPNVVRTTVSTFFTPNARNGTGQIVGESTLQTERVRENFTTSEPGGVPRETCPT